VNRTTSDPQEWKKNPIVKREHWTDHLFNFWWRFFIWCRSQVITDQHILKGQKENGFPVRKWKISLMGINANGEEESLPYVDHVEYILHQSFEQPLRSRSTPSISFRPCALMNGFRRQCHGSLNYTNQSS
jgi:hypothetical protein